MPGGPFSESSRFCPGPRGNLAQELLLRNQALGRQPGGLAGPPVSELLNDQ